jgi:hypothetical protein
MADIGSDGDDFTVVDMPGVVVAIGEAAPALNRSYFADCERDDKGRCMPAGGAKAGYASPKEQEASVKIAKSKGERAPVPPPEKVAKMRAALERAKNDPKARAGGDARGSSYARRARAEKLFEEFGGKEKGYVVCPWTGLKMHYTDDPELNPKGYPKFEQGKIFTAKQGGGYQLANLIPESFAANRARNDKPTRRENLGPVPKRKATRNAWCPTGPGEQLQLQRRWRDVRQGDGRSHGRAPVHPARRPLGAAEGARRPREGGRGAHGETQRHVQGRPPRSGQGGGRGGRAARRRQDEGVGANPEPAPWAR